MKKQRTSAEQRCSEASSAEQPVVDGPTQGTFCVITHADMISEHNLADVKVDMLGALRVAMKESPDAIIVCLARLGATAEVTFLLMKLLCAELESMERQDEAPAIKQRNSVDGVICICFNPDVRKHADMDPHNGVPAMFLSFGSLMVVAASWPTMPMRVCERCLDTYVAVATAAGQPVDFVVCGNAPDLGKLQIDALVAKAQCKATINGSNVVFLADGLAVENISLLQIGGPSVSALKTDKR